MHKISPFIILFSIKVVVLQQKESCFQIVGIMYWQYILIPFRMRRLHLSLLYVGHCCIIKRPSSFNAPSSTGCCGSEDSVPQLPTRVVRALHLNNSLCTYSAIHICLLEIFDHGKRILWWCYNIYNHACKQSQDRDLRNLLSLGPEICCNTSNIIS